MPPHQAENGQPAADAGAQRLARVYAEALWRAAEERGQVDAIDQEFASFVREVLPAPDLEALLSSHAIGRKKKAEILDRAFAGRTSELFFNFLKVLNEHERLDLLRPVLASFRQLRDEQARRVRVRVRSAVEMQPDQRGRLVQELRETFHVEPVLEEDVDPDLLGGLVVRLGDWVFDASVRKQLDSIRNELMARSSYEIQSRRDQFCTQ